MRMTSSVPGKVLDSKGCARTVINGSDLGKEYSAKAILETFLKPEKRQSKTKNQRQNPDPPKEDRQRIPPRTGDVEKENKTISRSKSDTGDSPQPGYNHRVPQLLSDLFRHQRDDDMPQQLTQDQRKKKRKHL
jgi:hypothetical protein